MATTNKTYLDYTGLQAYDSKIKEWVGDQIEDLDVAEFALAEKNSSTNVITIHGISETDGEIAIGASSANDVTLAAVAATGAAEDVSITDSGSYFTSDNVEGALAELAQASAGGVASKTVYITETSGSSSDPYSKRYGIYQGATGSSSSPVIGEKLVDIDIPKDMVVEDGAVVDVVFVAADNSLHEGSASGTDVTAEIKGTGTATAADAGKYIKLTIANATASHLWIKATDLVDIYTAASGATQVQLAIDNNNVISASLVAGGVGTTEIADDAVTADKVAISAHSETQTAGADGLALSVTTTDGQVSAVSGSIAANTYEAYGAVSTAIAALDATESQTAGTDGLALSITEVDGVITSISGSIAANTYDAYGAGSSAASAAIAELDTDSDVSIASYTAGTSGSADVITLQGSVKEVDGIIDAGTADTITLSTITAAEIANLFPAS